MVLPQLESWQALFNIFDLKRNGRVSYSELNQGLCTSCSPEIEIVQNASMVKELLNAMAFVTKEEELVDLVIDLCVDNPPAFGSRAAGTSVCKVTEVRKRSPSAVHHCLEHFPEDWQAFKLSVKRCADMATSRSDLGGSDALVYNHLCITTCV